MSHAIKTAIIFIEVLLCVGGAAAAMFGFAGFVVGVAVGMDELNKYMSMCFRIMISGAGSLVIGMVLVGITPNEWLK